MSIPHHTHDFTIPVATKEDIQQGSRSDLAVVPSSLGSAAIANHSDFATAEQGAKADSAVQAQFIGKLATKDKISVTDIQAEGIANKTVYLNGDGQWTIPKPEPYKFHISSGEGLDVSYLSHYEIRLTMSQDLKRKIRQFNKLQQEFLYQIILENKDELTITQRDSDKLSISINPKYIHNIVESYVDRMLVGTICEFYGNPNWRRKKWFPCKGGYIPLKEYPLFADFSDRNTDKRLVIYTPGYFRIHSIEYSKKTNYGEWIYVGDHIQKDPE